MATSLWRIRNRSTFAELEHQGSRARAGAVAIIWKAMPASEDCKPQVAYATGRRVGSAVARNKVRRRLRAIMAEVAGDLAPGAYLVSAGSKSSGATFDGLRGNVWIALKQLGALPEELEAQPRSSKR